MLLKEQQIRACLQRSFAADPLVITPLAADPDRNGVDAGAASVDLRLGTWFLELRRARLEIVRASSSHQDHRLTKAHYVPFGSEYILHPRAFVLGVTLEWIRLPADIGGYVIGRSSW